MAKIIEVLQTRIKNFNIQYYYCFIYCALTSHLFHTNNKQRLPI